MRKCIVVFRSRLQVMAFLEHFKRRGKYCITIATPKEAKLGCGLSCEINICDVEFAKIVIKSNDLTAFYGFFIVEKIGSRTSTYKI